MKRYTMDMPAFIFLYESFVFFEKIHLRMDPGQWEWMFWSNAYM